MTTAVIFPGQGSQSQGMLEALSQSYPQVQQRFDQASQALGFNLWALVRDNPNGQLNNTANAQPALLTAGIACYDILRAETDLTPQVMAGHSLGEYTALCAAGAIPFEDAVKLVHTRGKLMQEAVPYGDGVMVAILGLEDEVVAEICALVKDTVDAANFNAPGQVVIAGTHQGVAAAVQKAKEHGAKRAIELPVSVPSHCRMMKTAAARFSLFLERIHWQMPEIPIIHNVDADIRHNVDGIKSILGAQLYKPVRWAETIERMVRDGVTYCVEAGPGKVLTGLNKRIDKTLITVALDSPEAVATLKTWESV